MVHRPHILFVVCVSFRQNEIFYPTKYLHFVVVVVVVCDSVLCFLFHHVFFPSIDAPMPELNSRKRTFPSSRSTDAKTSETPVVDDATQPPPNSTPGEQQPQQQRVYKKVNKRVNKKVKRES